jgi:hypothetical protein
MENFNLKPKPQNLTLKCKPEKDNQKVALKAQTLKIIN